MPPNPARGILAFCASQADSCPPPKIPSPHAYGNVTEEVLNRDLTSVGTFDVFVPAHVAPRMSAAMLKESLSRPKYYKLIWGNSMLHVSNCHIFLIRRLILLFLVSIY